jgi:hydrogenase nickel incorporation protein HypA/HybF
MKTTDYHILHKHRHLVWFHEHIFQRTVVLFLFSVAPKTPQVTESSSIHPQISEQFFSPKKPTLKEKKNFFYLKKAPCTHSILLSFVTFKPSPPVSTFRMHEWALAESVILTAVEAAQKEHLKKITEITVQIGELQQIEKEIFLFALTELAKSQHPKIQNNAFHLKTEKSTLTCKNCGEHWTYDEMKNKLTENESESIHFIPEIVFVHARCPSCGSPDFEITRGRGVTLTSIKGVR